MGRLNVRAYVMVLAAALVLFILVVVSIQGGWGIFRRPEVGRVSNEEALEGTVLDPDQIDLDAVALSMAVIPPASNMEQRTLTLQLQSYQIFVADTSVALDADKVCLQITFTEGEPIVTDYHEVFAEPRCISLSNMVTGSVSEYVEGLEGTLYIFDEPMTPEIARPFVLKNPDQVNLNYWYPFDQFSSQLGLLVGYQLYRGDTVVSEDAITPYLAWEYQTSGIRMWNVDLQTEAAAWPAPDDGGYGVYAQDNAFTRIKLSFWRPLLLRLAFPLFLIGMVLLIGLIPLLQDRDTLVDITAAMLFGIYGIKGILGPGAEMGTTILDIGLIMLYALLAIAVAIFFVNKINLRLTEQKNMKQGHS